MQTGCVRFSNGHNSHYGLKHDVIYRASIVLRYPTDLLVQRFRNIERDGLNGHGFTPLSTYIGVILFST